MNGSNKRVAPLYGALGLLCATSLAVAASTSSTSASAESMSVGSHSMDRSRSTSNLHVAARALRIHNEERRRLGLPPLKWNIHLEEEAGQWARVLSRQGTLQHADRGTRNGTGENLWMGTAGAWPVETMVEMFVDERKDYRHGKFPNISRTGNWADVGHYSQVVWRDTKEVGCAVVTARGNDVLVCRYWPAGNVWGRMAY